MRPAHLLPILNTIGCLALAAVLAIQWRKEHTLRENSATLRHELAISQQDHADARAHATALEADIEQLKDALAATSEARSTLEQELAAARATHTASTEKQVEAWQAAIAQRDARINELEAQLKAARTRLDEAISNIKKLNAR